jgi:sugar O-acyltransferase (sialic acid O-acetyltransferase NeuD family)
MSWNRVACSLRCCSGACHSRKVMNKKSLGILGAGPFSDLIRDLAIECGFAGRFVIFDDFAAATGGAVGRMEDSHAFLKRGEIDCLAVAVGYRHFALRQALFESFDDSELFPNFIHPRSFVSPRAKLGHGNLVFSQANVEAGAVVENNVTIFNQTSVTHDVFVGSHSFLSVGIAMGGRVRIGERCFIGLNATIVNDVEIGDDSLVCAGTFLSQSLLPDSCAVGNPHRLIDRIDFKG